MINEEGYSKENIVPKLDNMCTTPQQMKKSSKLKSDRKSKIISVYNEDENEIEKLKQRCIDAEERTEEWKKKYKSQSDSYRQHFDNFKTLRLENQKLVQILENFEETKKNQVDEKVSLKREIEIFEKENEKEKNLNLEMISKLKFENEELKNELNLTNQILENTLQQVDENEKIFDSKLNETFKNIFLWKEKEEIFKKEEELKFKKLQETFQQFGIQKEKEILNLNSNIQNLNSRIQYLENEKKEMLKRNSLNEKEIEKTFKSFKDKEIKLMKNVNLYKYEMKNKFEIKTFTNNIILNLTKKEQEEKRKDIQNLKMNLKRKENEIKKMELEVIDFTKLLTKKISFMENKQIEFLKNEENLKEIHSKFNNLKEYSNLEINILKEELKEKEENIEKLNLKFKSLNEEFKEKEEILIQNLTDKDEIKKLKNEFNLSLIKKEEELNLKKEELNQTLNDLKREFKEELNKNEIEFKDLKSKFERNLNENKLEMNQKNEEIKNYKNEMNNLNLKLKELNYKFNQQLQELKEKDDTLNKTKDNLKQFFEFNQIKSSQNLNEDINFILNNFISLKEQQIKLLKVMENMQKRISDLEINEENIVCLESKLKEIKNINETLNLNLNKISNQNEQVLKEKEEIDHLYSDSIKKLKEFQKEILFFLNKKQEEIKVSNDESLIEQKERLIYENNLEIMTLQKEKRELELRFEIIILEKYKHFNSLDLINENEKLKLKLNQIESRLNVSLNEKLKYEKELLSLKKRIKDYQNEVNQKWNNLKLQYQESEIQIEWMSHVLFKSQKIIEKYSNNDKSCKDILDLLK
eukprot:gene186-4432_t